MQSPYKNLSLVSAILATLLLSSCNSVPYSQATFAKSDTPSAVQHLSHEIQLDVGTGYSRTLKAGSEWAKVGTLPQGEVYKAHKGGFTLEGANVHEAYLVIKDHRLVGFYLPVEGGFSSINQIREISFNEGS